MPPQNARDRAFGVEFADHKRAKLDSNAKDCLQVIGAGLSRCGTTSLKAALEVLGFDPCHHMIVLTLLIPAIFLCFHEPVGAIALSFLEMVRP